MKKRRNSWSRTWALSLAFLAAAVLVRAQAPDSLSNPGNILIADQFNNRVIEVDSRGNIVWQFGNGSNSAGPNSVVAPNDEERIGTNTLICGTGAPPGSESGCPQGCPDNRVFIVNAAGTIVWQYGLAGVTGSGPDELNTPVFATFTPAHTVLIADQANQRVIEVSEAKEILWQYGTTGLSGAGPDQLNNPNSAELLANGNILIADESNNRVIEVTRSKNIVWQYGMPGTLGPLNGAAFASRLSNGNTLITDANDNRIVEVTPKLKVVFEYSTKNCSPDDPSIPTRAVRLKNGDTLISGQFNETVIVVDSFGNLVRTIGTPCVAGRRRNQLNAPYDAKVVGDYTGLTPPPMPLQP